MSSLYGKIVKNKRANVRVVQDLSPKALVFVAQDGIPDEIKNDRGRVPVDRGIHTIFYATSHDTLILIVNEQATCDIVLKWLNEDKDLPEKVKKQFPKGYEYLAEYVKAEKVELAFRPLP